MTDTERKTTERIRTRARTTRLKSQRLCTKCGQHPLFTAMLCVGCHEEAKVRHKRFRDKWRRIILNHYGAPYCACCGQKFEYDFLQLDHEGGWGATHRRTLNTDGSRMTRGNYTLFKWIRDNNYPLGFRVLCVNCNFADGHGGCPHQRNKEAQQHETAGMLSLIC